MSEYFVLVQGDSVYVKEGEFFRSQGGLKEPWGKNWKAVEANSIEDARYKTKIQLNHEPKPMQSR